PVPARGGRSWTSSIAVQELERFDLHAVALLAAARGDPDLEWRGAAGRDHTHHVASGSGPHTAVLVEPPSRDPDMLGGPRPAVPHLAEQQHASAADPL